MSLIDKIQQLDIHPDHDVRGGYSALGDNFANAIDGTGERETPKAAYDKKVKDDLNMSGLADDAGLITSGQGEQRKIAKLLLKEKKKERDRHDLIRQTLLDAARRLQALNIQLDGLMEDLEENLKQQAANNQLIALLNKGDLNRNNPDVAELIILAGLDPSLSDDELLEAAKDQTDSLKQAENGIRTEIDEVVAEAKKEADVLESVLDDPDASVVEKDMAREALANSPDVAAQIRLIEEKTATYEQAVESNSNQYVTSMSIADISEDAELNEDIDNALGGFDSAMPMP